MNNSEYYIKCFKHLTNKIQNISRLITLLEKDPKHGHLVHAELLKRLYEDKSFKITDVELKTNNKDVDIQLNNMINIQVWHGASIPTHNIIKGKISKLGGVESDWDKDEGKLFKKLNQLPDDNPGFLVCNDYHMGINLLPEWLKKIPDNKAVIQIYRNRYNEVITEYALLHCSEDFKFINLTKRLCSALKVQPNYF